MSRSKLYYVYKTTAREIQEYHNGHGTGPIIWDYLAVNFLGVEHYHHLMDSYHTKKNGRRIEELWALARDRRVPEHLRFCLACSFDFGYVAPRDWVVVGNCLMEAGDELRQWKPEWANHWREIGSDMIRCENRPRLLGVGVNCTSVDDQWSTHRQLRGRNDRAFDCIAYARHIDEPVQTV